MTRSRFLNFDSRRAHNITSAIDGVSNFWGAHPALDLPLVAGVGSFYIILVKYFPLLDLISGMSLSNRMAMYAAGAGVMALISGFAGIAISQYGSSSGKLVDSLRRSHGKVIRKNWLSVATWLLFSALFCIFCMMIDQGDEANFSRWVFMFVILFSLVKFLRLASVFSIILSAADKEASISPPVHTPKILK